MNRALSADAVLVDALAQVVETRRLAEAFIRAEAQGLGDDCLAASRNTQHRHVCRQPSPPAFGQEGQAVHHRHHQIEDDDTGPLSFQLAQPFLSVGSEYDVVSAAR